MPDRGNVFSTKNPSFLKNALVLVSICILAFVVFVVVKRAHRVATAPPAKVFEDRYEPVELSLLDAQVKQSFEVIKAPVSNDGEHSFSTAGGETSKSTKRSIPSDVVIDIQSARLDFQNKEYKRCRTTIEAVLSKHPALEDALAIRGMLDNYTGNYDEMFDTYQKLTEIAPTNGSYHIALGQCYWNRRDPKAAFDQLSIGLDFDPKNSYGYYLRGCIYMVNRDFESAGSDYAKYMQLEPDSTMAYGVMLQSLTERQLWRRMIEYTTEWIPKVAPSDKNLLCSLYVARVRAYAGLGSQNREATADVVQSIKLGATAEQLVPSLKMLNFNDPAYNRQVLPILNTWIEARPGDSRALLLRAALKKKSGDRTSSKVDFQELIARWPDNPWHYLDLASLQIAQQDWNGALATYSAMYVKTKDKKLALWERANVYRHLERYDKAICDYSELISMEPATPELYFSRSRAYEKNGQLKEANLDREKATALLLATSSANSR